MKTLKTIGRRALFNQAIALPIGLIVAAGNGRWMPSFIVATTYAQCIGALCWTVGHMCIPRIEALRGRVKIAAGSALFFVAGIAGAFIAGQISNKLFGYNTEAGTSSSLIMLGIGASITVLVGMIMSTVHELRFDLATTEAALREREIAEARLRQAKTEAELSALQARINPHFLFNTLNSIAALIGEDPAKAEATTLQLSSLFRYALQANTRGVVPVEEEITIVRRYLEIEKVRLGDRLNYHIDVAPELDALDIPALLLQPIVENAIKHGIAPELQGGTLVVRGRRQDDVAEFTVSDTGRGLQGEGGLGVGLENVRQRLTALYGARASVALTREGQSTLTRIRVPLSRVETAS